MIEAQEMFKNSNKVTRPEKALILGFMAGSRGLMHFMLRTSMCCRLVTKTFRPQWRYNRNLLASCKCFVLIASRLT
jgi:hypothetical protein